MIPKEYLPCIVVTIEVHPKTVKINGHHSSERIPCKPEFDKNAGQGNFFITKFPSGSTFEYINVKYNITCEQC